MELGGFHSSKQTEDQSMILPWLVPDLILITAEHGQVRVPKRIAALLRLSTIPLMPHLGHPSSLQLFHNLNKSNNMHHLPLVVKVMLHSLLVLL